MESNSPTLLSDDLRRVVLHIPRDLRTLMTACGPGLIVGGGFIRALVAGETPSDIDLFGPSKAFCENQAYKLQSDPRRVGAKVHKSRNAITVLNENRLPVPFITRWTFDTPLACLQSFDFSVCQAAVWFEAGVWRSAVGERFYSDLAAKRLHYTHPVREEEAGGSMLRAIKYVKRGYSIGPASLAAVIARVVAKIKDTPLADADPERVIVGLLREVDPLLVIDGLDVEDEHETPTEENSNG